MIYWIIRLLARILFKTFYRFKIRNSQRLPKKGPYLICANHCSFFDPVIISASIPRKVYWVVLKDLYRIRPLSILLRASSCIPVNGIIKRALDSLNQGKIIGIFPEGRRTYDGKLMKKGKKGAALMALKTGAPVLPAWINGAFNAYPRRAKFPKIYPIQVNFGEPLKFDVSREKIIDENVLKETTDRIMKGIEEAREELLNNSP